MKTVMGREIDFTRQLSADDELRVIIRTDKGQIAKFQVVQISTIDEVPYQVVRYDCAHGKPHVDRLCKTKPKKEYMADLPLEKLFKIASQDIEENYKKYRQEYARKVNERGKK